MNHKIKALFFDIDGTLVSFQTHQIPASTVQALEEAKANGVQVYISTGRPLSLITVLGSIQHLIDGYITTNGAYCFVGNHDVCQHAIPRESVDLVISQAIEQQFCCVLVGTKHLCVFQQDETFNQVFLELLKVQGIDKAVSQDVVLQEPILQLSPFITQQQETELMSKLPTCQSGRWHPAFTDITSLSADKGQGLQAMTNYLGLSLNETMAFGDGGNDITIIQQAGIGVAMGNAVPELKQTADYITTSVDEHGVREALIHYGIIAKDAVL